jgi:UDP-N-acetylmuramyl pentapeptide phosphotransferase/UDP-N-acetylglucosamine-1-phosphate transferase
MAVHFITLFICVALISVSATGMVLKYLQKKAILDHPNERSSHSIPTPRGGGIGVLIAVIPTILLIQVFSPQPLDGYLVVLLCAFGLALLSWLDDLYTLGAGIRFLTQIICVALCLYFLPSPEQGYLGGFLPILAEKIILGLGWVWFINLFNFMDGIDGISGVEIMSIAIGITLLSLIQSLNVEFAQMGLIFSAAALGFLKWNWHKAKVFMGDVGSVPMGFMLGWILILLAKEGLFIAALILALYYLMDATITLIKRALKKEKVWQAHREHFYQMAVKSGMAHDSIVIRIAVLNLCLIGWACLSLVIEPFIALVLAGLCVGLCLFYFQKIYKKFQANG